MLNCPNCQNELYEGEMASSHLPPDEGEPCLICDTCELTFTINEIIGEW